MIKISTLSKTLAVAVLTAMAYTPASAQWEQSLPQAFAQSVFVTSKGVVLAGDQNDSQEGGIFYSTDEGDTWNKSDIADKWWCRFFEGGDYIFAIAEYEPRIARSEDGGKSWTVMSYERVLADIVSAKELPYLHSYTASYDSERNRIYMPIYSETAGVIYSDDFGETWKLTDRESLLIDWGDQKAMDNFYGSTMFNGNFYALGLYGLWKYDADADKWDAVRDSDGNIFNSNALVSSIVRNGRFIAGHAAESTDASPEYLYSSTDMVNFTPMPKPHYEVEGIPEGTDPLSWYVRAITQDDERIYTGLLYSHIFYSEDEGETWTFFSEGLPKWPYGYNIFQTNTISLAASENYLFSAQFSVSSNNGGIWRVKKPELGAAPSVITDDSEVKYANGVLSVTSGNAMIEVFALDGSRMLAAETDALSTASLPRGIYTYRVALPGRVITGKIVVK